MKVSDYNYELPEELIAHVPLKDRDNSRLLTLSKAGEISHGQFTDIMEYINEGDVLVLNNSKVLPARLFATREGGTSTIEVVLLKQSEKDIWRALVRPGKKCKTGTVLKFGDDFFGKVLGTVEEGLRLIEMSYEGNFFEVLDRYGNMPLPPYIKEKLDDKDRYQTVYAKENGSAAAPTAGLHFTHELLDRVRKKGAIIEYVTLHVGLGTFRPVKVDVIEEHEMHSEYCTVSKETADSVNAAKARGNKVIAVGTTSVRTLESMTEGAELKAGSKNTDIFIYPTYEFKIVDRIITNFHLPESTLLMLVSAYAGRENILSAYDAAIREKYRFFSFGDAMLLY